MTTWNLLGHAVFQDWGKNNLKNTTTRAFIAGEWMAGFGLMFVQKAIKWFLFKCQHLPKWWYPIYSSYILFYMLYRDILMYYYMVVPGKHWLLNTGYYAAQDIGIQGWSASKGQSKTKGSLILWRKLHEHVHCKWFWSVKSWSTHGCKGQILRGI